MLLNWGHSWDVAHLGVVLPAVTAGMRQEIKWAATAEIEEGSGNECSTWRSVGMVGGSRETATVVTSNELKRLHVQRRLLKKIKSSRAVGTTCSECLRTHKSKGCTGCGGETKEAVPQSAVLAG